MTLATTVAGVRVVVPGTYSTLSVEDNLANVTPGPRNIVIFGEAAKGVPGSLLDLTKLFFTDYESLKAFYGSGPIVDAGRMIFQNQASPVFISSVNRLHVYKTNASTLAGRPLVANMSTYATLSAAEYGEDGNLISAQVQNATVEIKPSLTGFWVPKDEAMVLTARVSGATVTSSNLVAESVASDVVSGLSSASIDATGGAQIELISGAQIGVDLLSVTVSGSDIVVTCSAPFDGGGYASVLAGQVLYIPAASAIAGALSENVGAYVLTAKTATTLSMSKISSSAAGVEVAPVLPVAVGAVAIAGAQTSVASAEIMAHAPIVLSVLQTSAVGVGASLELYLAAGDKNLAQRLYLASAQSSSVSAAVALSASVALAVTASVGTFSITLGAFQNLPKLGDVVWVTPASLLAGAASANVGAWIVTAAGSTSVVATKAVSGGVSVASVALSGQENPFSVQPALGSTALGAKVHTSASERQVRLVASRQSDGLAFPAATVGGRVVLEIGYVGSAATLTITKSGRLQTAVSGGSGANMDIQLSKYATMGDLVAFINSKTGYKARVPSVQLNSLAPKAVLDQVAAVGILSGHSLNSLPGRVKSDYADFKKLVDDNFGLISYVQNTASVSYVGLPDAEASAQFLSGGSVGATTNASIASALDAALKIEVTQVVPLFSRDAAKDIDDGLTEPTSVYSIDAINALVKSHVATASNADYRKERFGEVSFHGTFEDAQLKAAELAAERLQMVFQLARAVNSSGVIQWFQPWMLSCAVAAGRVQAALGTSMLRKSFQVSDVKHIGDLSVFSDTLISDFDPDTKDLDRAIEAGLLVLRPVTGFGVRCESPDLSTRSRENDPKGWFFERISVQFVADEVLKTCRTTLESFIGERTSDVSASVVRKAINDIMALFISGGALRAFSIDSVRIDGNTAKVTLSIQPVEALEFIVIDVLAQRSVGDVA